MKGQCPECSPENLQYNYYGRTDFWNYPACLDDHSCYDIRYCFCPPEGDFDFNLDKCPNSVRDSYGCVLMEKNILTISSIGYFVLLSHKLAFLQDLPLSFIPYF